MYKQIFKLTSYRDKVMFSSIWNKIAGNKKTNISYKDKLETNKTFNNSTFFNNKNTSYKDKLGTWGSLNK